MSLSVGKSRFNSALAIVYNAPYLYNRFGSITRQLLFLLTVRFIFRYQSSLRGKRGHQVYVYISPAYYRGDCHDWLDFDTAW